MENPGGRNGDEEGSAGLRNALLTASLAYCPRVPPVCASCIYDLISECSWSGFTEVYVYGNGILIAETVQVGITTAEISSLFDYLGHLSGCGEN